MPCIRRAVTGCCGHDQCPHFIESGVYCIKLIQVDSGIYCEVGEGCYSGCRYSFRSESPVREEMCSALRAQEEDVI